MLSQILARGNTDRENGPKVKTLGCGSAAVGRVMNKKHRLQLKGLTEGGGGERAEGPELPSVGQPNPL